MLWQAHGKMEELQANRQKQRTIQMKEGKMRINIIEQAQRTSETERTKDTLFSTTAKTASIPRVNWKTLAGKGPPPKGGNTASIEPSTPGNHEQGPGQEILSVK